MLGIVASSLRRKNSKAMLNNGKKLSVEMCRPEGHLRFRLNLKKTLSEHHAEGGVIFEQKAGSHYFLLEQIKNNEIHFYHSSPGTGTRLAVAEISSVKSSDALSVSLTWTPKELRVYLGALDQQDGLLIQSIEVETGKKFQIAADRSMFTSSAGNVMAVRVTTKGEAILDSTAIESWNENIEAIEVLLRATSKDGYLFDVVQANFAAVSLVTGIETYNKRRLQELEGEGYELDFKRLEEFSAGDLTKDKIFGSTTNYFQSLDNMKKIWKHLTGLAIAEVHAEAWQIFKTVLFRHRHVVVHAHSFRAELPNGKDAKTLFVTNEIVGFKRASQEFIEKLHDKTLSLPPRK